MFQIGCYKMNDINLLVVWIQCNTCIFNDALDVCANNFGNSMQFMYNSFKFTKTMLAIKLILFFSGPKIT